MRKVIVISMITLDGVMQAPGGPEEDTSGGFKYGGWVFPYADEYGSQVLNEQLGHPFDLLLGRKTYDIWKQYWPQHKDGFIGAAFDRATKYVASTTLTESGWEKTVILKDNVVHEIKKLKQSDGPELQVHGSGNLIQTLLKNDLVDELWLKIFPITLGTGKRLFVDGVIPAAFTLENSSHSPSGVVFANLSRAGEVKTGSFS
jgi:dihydrofolate reductase